MTWQQDVMTGTPLAPASWLTGKLPVLAGTPDAQYNAYINLSDIATSGVLPHKVIVDTDISSVGDLGYILVNGALQSGGTYDTAYALPPGTNGMQAVFTRVAAEGFFHINAGDVGAIIDGGANDESWIELVSGTVVLRFWENVWYIVSSSGVWHHEGTSIDEHGVAEFDASTTATVTFVRPRVDDQYIVLLGPRDDKTYYVSARTANDFTITASGSTSASIDWLAKDI